MARIQNSNQEHEAFCVGDCIFERSLSHCTPFFKTPNQKMKEGREIEIAVRQNSSMGKLALLLCARASADAPQRGLSNSESSIPMPMNPKY